jgi:hypothetical protein
MVISTYDPCLLVTIGQIFGLIGMQTNDILHLCSPEFSATEEKKSQKAGFRSKPKTSLSKSSPLEFNEGRITLLDDHLSLRQKGQSSKLKLVDIKAKDYAQQYLEQRARGAYLASVCQPEAAFDLLAAAQASNSTPEDAAALNKRLQWQMEHLDRGLDYIALDLNICKFFIFANGSFANNKDLSFQLGFLILLANECVDRAFSSSQATLFTKAPPNANESFVACLLRKSTA